MVYFSQQISCEVVVKWKKIKTEMEKLLTEILKQKCRSRFKPISFGHCINKNSRKIIYDSDTCEKFQKRDYESDKKLIEKKIEEIAQDIFDLIQIKSVE